MWQIDLRIGSKKEEWRSSNRLPKCLNGFMEGLFLSVRCVCHDIKHQILCPASLWISQPWWEHELKVIKNAATCICRIRPVLSSTFTSVYMERTCIFTVLPGLVVCSITNILYDFPWWIYPTRMQMLTVGQQLYRKLCYGLMTTFSSDL